MRGLTVLYVLFCLPDCSQIGTHTGDLRGKSPNFVSPLFLLQDRQRWRKTRGWDFREKNTSENLVINMVFDILEINKLS